MSIKQPSKHRADAYKPQIHYFLNAAKQLKISVKKVPGSPFYEFKKGNKSILFNDQYASTLGALGYIACEQKAITKGLLKAAGISTPAWREFYTRSTSTDVKKYSKQLQFPVVVKPSYGFGGGDVETHLSKMTDIIKHVQTLQKNTSVIIVEEMFVGTEVRLFATRSQFIAATTRRPASILGDGKHTITQLVKKKNAHPKRSEKHSVLYPILLDAAAKQLLKKNKLNANSIPEKGERIFLRTVSNLSAGGDSIDVTDLVHPSVKQLAINCVRSIPQLPFAGIDFMTTDYTKKQTSSSYTIIELNARPMLNIHYYPYKGKPRAVAETILREALQ